MTSEETEIQSYRVPFGTYDFFGYLIPGMTLIFNIYLICIGYHWSLSGDKNISLISPVNYFLEDMSKILNSNASTFFQITVVIFLLIFAYVIGHIIGSISSLFLDRILVFKAYGYPYESIIQNKTLKLLKYDVQRKIDSNQWRAIFFWANFLLVIWIVSSVIYNSLPKYIFSSIVFSISNTIIVIVFLKVFLVNKSTTLRFLVIITTIFVILSESYIVNSYCDELIPISLASIIAILILFAIDYFFRKKLSFENKIYLSLESLATPYNLL